MFFYSKQIKRYLAQAMNVFRGFEVEVGLPAADGTYEHLTVPVQYGSKDRVTAAILTDNSKNKPIRLPLISCYMTDIAFAPGRLKGWGLERKTPYVPLGGMIPQDIKVIHQLMPTPYDMTIEMTLYTSNIETHFQLLEQILVMFDPLVQLQTTDAPFDWTKITSMELRNVRFDEAYPSGNQRRIIQTTLQLYIPIHLSVPSNIKDDVIKRIRMRVGMVNGVEGASSYDLIAQLDNENLDYYTTDNADNYVDAGPVAL